MKSKPENEPAFKSALLKNRTGRKPLKGITLSIVRMGNSFYHRFNIGQDTLKRAELHEGDVLDFQIDAGRKLGRLTKITEAPGEPEGNTLTRTQSITGALQVRFNVDRELRDLVAVERVTELRLVEVKIETIVFELPAKPDWKRAA